MQHTTIPQLLSLDGRIRCIYAPTPTRTVYAGVLVGAGTRHELPEESGMAHLLEHMSFKGTARRTATQVINRIETVGGDLNAYTGKEETVYYAACLPEHLPRTLDLLEDIVFHSTYPDAELQREVEVVCDEIDSYEDSPAELIYDDFDALLFPGHALGRNILGRPERLRRYASADLQAFAARNYRPVRAVMFILGPAPHAVMRRLHPSSGPMAPFATVGDPLPPASGAPAAAHETIVHRGTHQAHVVIGTTAPTLAHPDFPALSLLNNILGGPSMNSRLNMALRERRGLVYTVESSIAAYADTAVWTTYFGCDPADVGRCLGLAAAQFRRLAEAPLSPRQLAAAQRQLCGQLAIAADNHESRAIALAKRLYLTGTLPTLDDTCAAIRAVTATQLQSVARRLLDPDALHTLVYN